ncbi:MAG: hypothetical protein K2I92_04445 [Muribaculaceae bacterium]|nr:hypothetical protein [Muribaculaceae bacterium]
MDKYRLSFRNIGRWLTDQLSYPKTLLKKKSWGVFSVYAHLRRSDRLPKKASPNREKALATAGFMADKYGGSYSIYKCVFCDGWHIAKDSTSKTESRREKDKVYHIGQVSNDLNTDRILLSGIPDIALVYGGVRGRTLSSPKQAFAWPIVKECGIRTIIDLREDGIYTRTQELCDRYEMEYFYYPVDKELKHISEMVSMFPKFCSMIDKGHFYIACAMGLHRTDVALCAYWVFYGADKGIAPPAIRGYRKSDGHDTDIIMRVLNAMYKEFAERNGSAPIPFHIFNERKNIIKQRSTL